MNNFLKTLLLITPLLAISAETAAVANEEYRPTFAFEQIEEIPGEQTEDEYVESEPDKKEFRHEFKVEVDEDALEFSNYVIGLMIFMVIASLAFCVFWFFMLVHALTKPIEHKVVWVIVLIFLPFLGALLYYFVVKRNTAPNQV